MVRTKLQFSILAQPVKPSVASFDHLSLPSCETDHIVPEYVVSVSLVGFNTAETKQIERPGLLAAFWRMLGCLK